jgi:hypothetical protein
MEVKEDFGKLLLEEAVVVDTTAVAVVEMTVVVLVPMEEVEEVLVLL